MGHEAPLKETAQFLKDNGLDPTLKGDTVAILIGLSRSQLHRRCQGQGFAEWDDAHVPVPLTRSPYLTWQLSDVFGWMAGRKVRPQAARFESDA